MKNRCPHNIPRAFGKDSIEDVCIFLCISKIGGGLFLIHSTELLHSNIPDFFVGCFVVSEVHRFEFARRNDDRGGAVKMCFQMLPPVFFLGGVKMYLSTNLLFLVAIDMSLL